MIKESFHAGDNEPKYEAFSKFLLKQIQSGIFPPGCKLPAERDLARRYNIAHMTVNKALNGLVSAGYLKRMPPRGTFVNEITPLRNAAAVMDYRAMHAQLPQPLQHVMADAGFVLTVFDIHQVAANPDLFANFCRAQQPELLLVEGYSLLPFGIFDRLPEDLPRIVFHRNEHERQPGVRYVLNDFVADGRLAARMLLEAGKRRIGIFTGIQDTPLHTDHAFVRGIETELAQHGLAPVFCWDEPRQTEAAIERLIAEELVDGVVSILDSRLVPVIKEVRRQGKSVPEDIALVGHNNTPWADSFDISSIDILPREMAEAICRLAEDPEAGDVVLSGVPVYRASCPEVTQVVFSISS